MVEVQPQLLAPAVVTPQQLTKGYVLRVAGVVIELPYKVISKLHDGNYLVSYSHRIIRDR